MTLRKSARCATTTAARLRREAGKLRKQTEPLKDEAINLLSPDQCQQAASNITGRKEANQMSLKPRHQETMPQNAGP